MRKKGILFLVVLLSLTSARFSSAQQPKEGLFQALSIKIGAGIEYFSRKITWDDEKYSSKLKSGFFTFNSEFEIMNGFFLNAVFGYSLSNYDLLEFRELPISLDLGEDSKSIGGYLLGVEIKKSLIYSEKIKVDGLGQLFFYLGSKQEWEIPDLAVPGSAEGKPTWGRASIGPVFTYTGFDSFSPYLYLNFNRLWGAFKMDETVRDLEGTENKEISGESSFCTSLGVIYKLTATMSLKGEASFMPYKNGVDLGFMIKTIYSF